MIEQIQNSNAITDKKSWLRKINPIIFAEETVKDYNNDKNKLSDFIDSVY